MKMEKKEAGYIEGKDVGSGSAYVDEELGEMVWKETPSISKDIWEGLVDNM